MILFDEADFISEANSQTKNIELRQIASKVKSLNLAILNLLRKKERIDLEIKRTKVKLSQMKNISKKYISESLHIEESTFGSISKQDLVSLCEESGLEAQVLFDLDAYLDEALELENQYEIIKPYLLIKS